MRCQHPQCNKKITLCMELSNKCRCNNIYCNKHRHPCTHECTVDHKALERSTLKKALVEVKPIKVIAI